MLSSPPFPLSSEFEPKTSNLSQNHQVLSGFHSKPQKFLEFIQNMIHMFLLETWPRYTERFMKLSKSRVSFGSVIKPQSRWILCPVSGSLLKPHIGLLTSETVTIYGAIHFSKWGWIQSCNFQVCNTILLHFLAFVYTMEDFSKHLDSDAYYYLSLFPV